MSEKKDTKRIPEKKGSLEKKDTKKVPEKKDTKGVLEKKDTKGVPEKKDTKGVPEKKDSKGSPEKKDTKGSLEKKDIKGSLEKKDTKGVLEKKDTKGVPEKKDTKGVPEKKDSKGSLEKKDIKGSLEKKDTKGVLEKKDTKGVPEKKDTKGVPEKKDSKGSLEKKDIKGSLEKKDTKGVLEKKDTKGVPEKKDTKGVPEKKDSKGSPEKKDTKGSLEKKDIKGSQEKKDTKGVLEKKDSKGSPEKKDTKGSLEKKDIKGSPEKKDTKGSPAGSPARQRGRPPTQRKNSDGTVWYINTPRETKTSKPYENVETRPTRMAGSRPHYENIANLQTGTKKRTAGYENVGTDGRVLLTHHSEPTMRTADPSAYEDVRSRALRTESALPTTKGRLLIPAETRQCPQCKELQQLVSLWELGVSGLARNYSRILAQLTKARDAATCLESKMKQRAGIEGSLQSLAGGNSPALVRGKHVRHSVHESSLHTTTPTEVAMADSMYPGEGEASIAPEYARYMRELNSHLGKAIDLCQQLAAACFKKNQASDYARLASPIYKKPIQRQASQPEGKSHTPPGSPYRPPLVSISEDNPSGTLRRRRALQKQLSTGSLNLSHTHLPPAMLTNGAVLEESDSEGGGDDTDDDSENDTSSSKQNGGKESKAPQVNGKEEQKSPVHEASPGSDSTSQAPSVDFENPLLQKPFHSHMMSLIAADEEKRLTASSFVLLDSGEQAGEKGNCSARNSTLSQSSTYSDNDVKHVMSKIAGLEEERLKLLETIEDLQHENQQVRLSLYETMGDLENKDLQLTLAMQDLTIATDEMKMAVRIRNKIDSLESDRNQLLDRLSNLEDESAAVKVSLIQLLQEKSATNKTLAVENLRLSQRVRQMGTGQRRLTGDGDNVSVTSNVSSVPGEIDAALQETFMGLDDAGCFVHKQGFLVKQGGKVKNWKKRLFVLDSEGLSYFRTEQPITKLALSAIESVQISHGRPPTPFPNMFEVHTRDRIYYLSAPTGDEMQSWVGMLQTLKQYNRRTNRQPNRGASVKVESSSVVHNLPKRPLSEASLDIKITAQAREQLQQQPEQEKQEAPQDQQSQEEQPHDQLQESGESDEATPVLDGRDKDYSKSVPSSPAFREEGNATGSCSLDLVQLKPL